MGTSVRTLKILLCTAVLIVTALLVTDVVDLCRVLPSGEIEFSPRVEHAALRRWGTAVAESFSPADETPGARLATTGAAPPTRGAPVLAAQGSSGALRR